MLNTVDAVREGQGHRGSTPLTSTSLLQTPLYQCNLLERVLLFFLSLHKTATQLVACEGKKK